MATNYPTSLDTLTDPSGSNKLNSPSHAGQHANANDAIVALETKVGITGSGVNTTVDYKLSGVATGDKSVSLTGTEVLTNKTLTSPTINTPTIATPTVTNGTFSTPTLTQPTSNSPVFQGLVTGWIECSEVWTYSAAASPIFTVTVPSDATTRYSKGDKIRLKQGGAYKYFSVNLVTSTTLQLYGGSDYTLTNAAIANNAYAKGGNAVGHPDWFSNASNTPVMACSASMTIGTIAVSLYKARLIGAKMEIKAIISATIGGTPDKYVYLTMDVPRINSVAGEKAGSVDISNTTFSPGTLFFNGTSTTQIGAGTYNNANYSAGAGQILYYDIAYDI